MFLIGPYSHLPGTIISAVQRLGLTANLQLCLDAGDLSSYDGTSQKWLDRSGGGYDFFLGSDGTTQSSDPTFNGTAGAQSTAEYFSVDGGDNFTYDTSNETWMQDLHKAGSRTFLAIVELAADQDTILFSTAPNWTNTSTSAGCSFGYVASANRFGFAYPVTGGGAFNAGTVRSLTPEASPIPGLYMVGQSLQLDADGTRVIHAFVNDVTASGSLEADTDYRTTSGTPSNTATLMSFAGGNTKAPNGTKLHGIAVWNTALTAANLSDLWTSLRGRYGL